MFTDLELTAAVYLILYFEKGENQSDLVSRLKGYGSKLEDEIDDWSDEDFVYTYIDYCISELTDEALVQPCQIDHLLENVQRIRKQEAFAVIANLSSEKRIKIAKSIEGLYVPDESYFQDCYKTLNLPIELQGDEICVSKKKVYCVECGSETYCFASRNEAEMGVKILSGNDMRPAIQMSFRISEQMKPLDCYIWTLAALVARERKMDMEWYSGPAFIANDADAYFKRIQESVARNRGLLGASSSRPKPPQQTGCLVPLVVFMTWLVLSCIVVAIGGFMLLEL